MDMIWGMLKMPEGEICLPNINPRERLRRLTVGIGLFFLGLVVLALLISCGVDRRWRLMLFPMFAGAAAGYFQWRDQT